MIDLNEEQMLTLTQATAELPGRPHIPTIWRWHARGLHGVKLETIVIGGRRFTSREALQRFAERTTAAAGGTSAPARTSKQRTKAIAAADETLKQAGIS